MKIQPTLRKGRIEERQVCVNRLQKAIFSWHSKAKCEVKSKNELCLCNPGAHKYEGGMG